MIFKVNRQFYTISGNTILHKTAAAFVVLNPFRWSDDCRIAFETVKGALVEAPILAIPDLSLDACPFILDTDASNHGIEPCCHRKELMERNMSTPTAAEH